MSYASGTQVSVDKSKSELKKVVYTSGGSNYKYAEEEDRAMVMFSHSGRMVRFMITFPAPDDRMFTRTPTGRSREPDAAYKEYEAEQRRRWRALILAVKAKFEVVESGIATFEEEFLPYILMPNGQTVAQMALPTVRESYESGTMPDTKLLPGA